MKVNSEISVNSDYERSILPQANSLDKIADSISVMMKSPINSKDLSSAFSMVGRQGSYYEDALNYLGVINKVKYGDEYIIFLNDEALKYFKSGNIEEKLAKWIKSRRILEQFEADLLGGRFEMKDDTRKRRTSSLLAWRRWVEEVMRSK